MKKETMKSKLIELAKKHRCSVYRDIIFSLMKQLGKEIKCENCNSITNLCVHHIDNNPLNNDISNLEILCRKCHGLTCNFPNRAGKLNDNYKGRKKLFKCENCKSDFFSNKYRDYSRSKRHFCSMKCYNYWQKQQGQKISIKCLNCNKEFLVQPCLKNKRKFCSLKCTYLGRGYHAKKQTN